jgi:hypothetical protein
MTSQDSASTSNLLYGIIGIVFVVALEYAAIWSFFQYPVGEAIGVAMLMQLALIFVALLIYHLPVYKRRTHFAMYFVYIENADIKSIKENYHICFMDETGVLFVDKNAQRAYSDWALMHTVTNLSVVKEKLFPEPECHVTN